MTVERAQIAFGLYLQMGDTRSLQKLHRQLRALGVASSIATLKRWSARFNWRAQLAEHSTEASEELRRRNKEQRIGMEERHSQLARALQGAGGTALQNLLGSDARLASLKATDITRLLELGFRAERQVVGESTDRRDVILEAWNDVTEAVVPIFQAVNDEADPHVRARLFAHAIDRLVDERLAQVRNERPRGMLANRQALLPSRRSRRARTSVRDNPKLTAGREAGRKESDPHAAHLR